MRHVAPMRHSSLNTDPFLLFLERFSRSSSRSVSRRRTFASATLHASRSVRASSRRRDTSRASTLRRRLATCEFAAANLLFAAAKSQVADPPRSLQSRRGAAEHGRAASRGALLDPKEHGSGQLGVDERWGEGLHRSWHLNKKPGPHGLGRGQSGKSGVTSSQGEENAQSGLQPSKFRLRRM